MNLHLRPIGATLMHLVLLTLLVCSGVLAQRVPAVSEKIRRSATSAELMRLLETAKPGDTVEIPGGSYACDNLVISKPITLRGRGWPVLRAGGNGHILTVSAPHVTLTGLIIAGASVSYARDNAAIFVDSTSDCIISANKFQDNSYGVYLSNSSDCSILNNEIIGRGGEMMRSGNGVHLWKCQKIRVTGNRIEDHRDGIYLEFTSSSEMRDNDCLHNLRYGLHFMFSDDCSYIHNRFIGNDAGVAVMYTSRVTMENNEFSESWGSASCGLLLKDIRDSRMTGNVLSNNSVGIYMEGADRLDVSNNTFASNGWAIKIMANCVGSVISGNNFVDNSFQVATNSRQSNSRFSENFWSTYQGFDLDRDGFGDLPYRPVSLFSLLVESDPATLVLIRSLLVEVLNLAERIVPTLTPEGLADARPRMRPLI